MLRIALIISLFVVVGTTTGCDPVRTIEQKIDVLVTDHLESPLAEATVKLKPAFETSSRATNIPESKRKSRWQREQWSSATTNADGKATIRFERTRLDFNKGAQPENGSSLEGKRIVLVLESEGIGTESVEANLAVGEIIELTKNKLTIVSISVPRYLDRDKQVRGRQDREGGRTMLYSVGVGMARETRIPCLFAVRTITVFGSFSYGSDAASGADNRFSFGRYCSSWGHFLTHVDITGLRSIELLR